MRSNTKPIMILGTIPFGSLLNERESKKIILEAWDLGIREFDVASLYGGGKAIDIVGKCLKNKSEAVYCCSIGLEQIENESKIFSVGVVPLNKKNVLKMVDDLLYRLKIERINVLNIHAPDKNTKISVTLEALKFLQQTEKIEKISISNVTPDYLDMIIDESTSLDLKINRLQFHGNFFEQKLISEFTSPKYREIEMVCYRPFGRGLLTREYTNSNTRPNNSRSTRSTRLDNYLNKSFLTYKENFDKLANNLGVSKIHILLVWLFEIAMINGAVFGVRNCEQLNEVFPFRKQIISQQQIDAIIEFSKDPEFAEISQNLPLFYFEQ
jgi:aryl-alcohol dehydrogenase-like predicted oxidoreductase